MKNNVVLVYFGSFSQLANTKATRHQHKRIIRKSLKNKKNIHASQEE